jgi:hypothetical protein
MRPRLRAEGIMSRRSGGGVHYLVQRDDDESFYRFPGESASVLVHKVT